MITTSQAVSEIISRAPFLEEAVFSGIVNTSALARGIRSDVEDRLMKRVEVSAILMAIRRMKKEKTYTAAKSRLDRILSAGIDFIVRSNLSEIVIESPLVEPGSLSGITGLKKRESSQLLMVTEGVFETAVITSASFLPAILRRLGPVRVKARIEGLSAITMRLPKENVSTPGVYYYFLKVLAWESVNVVEIVSTYSEFTIILRSSDVERAFGILKKAAAGSVR